ncbi:hypothetical protein [Cohnella abietis]|uniref:Uncharacterized protein n=1 Tax=Cohnella abietis TaxID=2507935 RepID=A0A3T1D185_9BACL|nr:hypothetical protein [Cohnella abietis]BBI31860.1 hypothetical protein KCTCHS21_12590 [Cohnella abietis]
MRTLPKQVAQVWIDDQLDLFNFAVEIGDSEWQNQILEQFKHKEVAIEELKAHRVRQELWIRFDEVNQKMLELYEQLRINDNSDRQQALKERVWELKVQRNVIGHQIREIG